MKRGKDHKVSTIVLLILPHLLFGAVTFAQTPRLSAHTASPAAAPDARCVDGWHDGLPVDGVDGHINDIAFDGAGGVYIGGGFTLAGDVTVNNIARWDGSAWSALGAGMNGEVRAIAVSGTDVYAAGTFTTAGGTAANYIAKWNGSSWSPVGSGLESPATDIEVSGMEIYVGGGAFDPSDGSNSGYVAKWNGSNWTNLGSEMDGTVIAIGVAGSDVYARRLNEVIVWNGSDWSAFFGPGPNGFLDTIAVSGTDVYVGSHSGPGGLYTAYVSKWNGSSWSVLGTGMTSDSGRYASVSTIAVAGTDIYAAGQFSTAGGTPANGFAKWNGSAWSAVGSSSVAYVSNIAASGPNVVVSSGGRLARWNGSTWSTIGSTEQVSRVSSLTVSGSDVYAGGYFTTDSGTTFSGAAIWNGSGWTSVGLWPQDPIWARRSVIAVAASGTNVYVGGWGNPETGAEGVYVARWDGSSWSTLVSGVTIGGRGDLLALAASGSDLYVGGDFATIDGITVNGIAKWNGSGWSSLGTGVAGWGYVSALSISGTDVYAGGAFFTAGGIPAHMIAKWNGTSWSALGSGPLASSGLNRPEDFDNAVRDIEVSGTDVYVAGGVDDNYNTGFGFVSKWNGSNWTELPRPTYGLVPNIAVSGSDVYASGNFLTTGGGPINNLAKWNGSSWLPLGSGVNGGVNAISAHGGDLFIGGSFTTAGCHVSAYFARYSLPIATEASVSGRVTTPTGVGLRNAVVSITDSQGVMRTATTSSFGMYSSTGIPAGGTYTISVSSRRYRFAPRSITADGNLTNIDFMGLE